eukprot:CAMPEP_0179440882 /NCGR_PEP_ID=MMETSP0799-20121207/24493_1 /TAXON_ID=46947 /ORGANISM="Geminigera cryophila, Strain CCMP2564" /LENGTH=72 /DNA_ID=CAMNT_0021224699 /DNA_START=38 /DNA_END=256 /DNA_ORIENTATION=-
MLFSLLGDEPFETPGVWDAQSNAAIGGADYGKPMDDSVYSDIKESLCAKRRTHCDWTVVGPVAANGLRWEFK